MKRLVGLCFVLALSACGGDDEDGRPLASPNDSARSADQPTPVPKETAPGNGNLLVRWGIGTGQVSQQEQCDYFGIEYFGVSYEKVDNPEIQGSFAIVCVGGIWNSYNDFFGIPAGTYRVRIHANAGPKFAGPEIAKKEQVVEVLEGDAVTPVEFLFTSADASPFFAFY